ncbi:N-acetylglucosaminyl-diphospho-decaprenol L-rhamnosyltransferase [Gammaproteobacteria bacterium]
MLTDIIIVNWNAGLQLAALVNSIILHHSNLVSSVVIVDNASTDNSLARIKETTDVPFLLHIIQNTENRGFSAACNQGAALASSEYLLFLNPDTRLFKNSLSAPLEFMQRPENIDVGIIGIQLIDDQNHVSRSCARFPSLSIFIAYTLGLNHLHGLQHLNLHMSNWTHDRTKRVDHVIGAFYLIRYSLFESLGGFDERFFVYLEDLDLSLRAHQSGWRSIYFSEAQAFHAGGGTSQQVQAHRLFYSLRSRLLYGFKHFTPWQAWTLLTVMLILEPISRSIYSLLRGKTQDFHNTWHAYKMLYVNVIQILRISSLKKNSRGLND